MAKQCKRRSLPVVLFGRVQVDSHLTAICGDNYNGARDVAKRFVLQGRKRIAFLGGLPTASTHLERRRGFIDALEDAGSCLYAEYEGGFRYETAHELAKVFTIGGKAPDAVFCANDVMAFGVIDAARATGLAMMDDLAVIGYDDVPMAAWQSYRLTTVRQRARLMVAEALKIVADIIDTPALQGSIRITPCFLVERDSG
jgi:DNA-binding LacI/PurR family transcriptional regulator